MHRWHLLENMREIGRVKLVQVQPSSLKVGELPNKYYDPSPLLVVETLLLTPQGAIGVTPDGNHITDVHHTDHPSSRNDRGVNDLSIGFTSHYTAIRARFGQYLTDGYAGENILVETDSSFALPDLQDGLAIQNPATGEVIYLTNLKVAAPCVEFSQYAANHGMPLPAEQLQEVLQFLHNGKRGFYTRIAEHQSSGSVRANDRAFIVDAVNSIKEGT